MQAGTYNAVDDRHMAGLVSERNRGASGDGSTILGGVVPGYSQMAVSAPGSTMQINISAGSVMIPAPGASPAGAYLCHNQSTTSFTLNIVSGANPRIDAIYAEVEDQTTGGSESEWRLGVQEGSPSASPVAPTLSTGRFLLAHVRVLPAAMNGGVNKITSAQITDQRVFLSAIGGTYIKKDGLPNPPHSPGKLLYNQSSKYLYISDGSTWNFYYTYQQWLNYFAGLRPAHISSGVAVYRDGTAGTWNANPYKNSGGGAIHSINVTRQSPSGSFIIHQSAHLKTSNTRSSAQMSMGVYDGSTQLLAPSTNYRAVGGYSLNWEHHGVSYMVTGMPANKNLTFRLFFQKAGNNADKATFTNYYLLVQPVL